MHPPGKPFAWDMARRTQTRTGRPTWRPSSVDYQRVFMEQNPWRSSGEVPASWAPPIERRLPALLSRRLLISEPHRFQLVLGPRRVGKTTCLYQTVRSLLSSGVAPARIWWLRLDHPLLMRLDLHGLLAVVRDGIDAPNEPAFVFLDELTYARDWDLWLKTFHDERWPFRIAGSSSSTAALRERRLESGVGRWEEQYLAPYLFGEFLDLVNRHASIPVEATLSETILAALRARYEVTALPPFRRIFLLTGGFPELLVAASADAAGDDEVSTLLPIPADPAKRRCRTRDLQGHPAGVRHRQPDDAGASALHACWSGHGIALTATPVRGARRTLAADVRSLSVVPGTRLPRLYFAELFRSGRKRPAQGTAPLLCRRRRSERGVAARAGPADRRAGDGAAIREPRCRSSACARPAETGAAVPLAQGQPRGRSGLRPSGASNRLRGCVVSSPFARGAAPVHGTVPRDSKGGVIWSVRTRWECRPAMPPVGSACCHWTFFSSPRAGRRRPRWSRGC